MPDRSNYRGRASRIVDRVLPPLRRIPHGFHNPHGFIAAAQYQGQRNRLWWRVWALIRAKADGGPPRIRIPDNSDHLWGPGDAMFDVAAQLEREFPA